MLGQKIAASLDDNDVLAGWMAHYLAGRLARLEALTGTKKEEEETAVADLIIQIWEHRQAVDFRDDPLTLADSVERAVARLDPSADSPFHYFRPFDEEAGPSAEEIQTSLALKLALAIDNAAEELVRSLTKYAAMLATNKDAAWVQVSRKALPSTYRDLSRLMGFESEIRDGLDPIVAEKERVAKRSQSLSKILRSASKLSTHDPALPE